VVFSKCLEKTKSSVTPERLHLLMGSDEMAAMNDRIPPADVDGVLSVFRLRHQGS
jgi:hypothetical protein